MSACICLIQPPFLQMKKLRTREGEGPQSDLAQDRKDRPPPPPGLSSIAPALGLDLSFPICQMGMSHGCQGQQLKFAGVPAWGWKNWRRLWQDHAEGIQQGQPKGPALTTSPPHLLCRKPGNEVPRSCGNPG